MLARRYEDAMAAVEGAICDNDIASLKEYDALASLSFEEILSHQPKGRQEEREMLDFLLEKLCLFDREGALWPAIRNRICELFDNR